MSHRLDVRIDGTEGVVERTLDVSRVYNLGFTIRDREKMQRHLDEVEGVNVEWPQRPPAIFPISPWATLTDEDVLVQYERTSGEVEIVIVDDGGEILVGVGSDHTDRELEATGIPWSKQVAPNIIAPTLWRWSEVEDHWDQVVIESYVASEPGDAPALYQKGSVAEFWTPMEMLDGVKGRIVETSGAKIFLSGTIVSEEEKLNFGRVFTMRLHDPVLDKKIEHTYTVTILSKEITS